jgi:NAD(P)-dependent dehydrogenase (short-subunit alcohol dehydrogenase family)
MGVKGETTGIGGATAWMFVREGAKVVLTDLDDVKGEKSVSQIREEGGDAIYRHLDVANEDEWIDVIQTTVSTYGKLDILVNAAGNLVQGDIESSTVEAWNSLMDVHAKGPFLGVKHAIPEMRKAGGGSIINLSSINGLTGTNPSPGYTAGKAASRLLSKAAAVRYAKENIRVNSVHPGYIVTPLSRTALSRPDGPTPEELNARRIFGVPMGREGTPDELAYGILFLASDDSSYVTGTELVIDGGFYAQ